ncbi:hypothetical protein BJ878DRAFT_480176 [Calycina marina]|uniref:Uncharacterized protein n=1 Tax=Calycina marina TaxID=1763456 RepID=A0A9P7Z3V8_9HELO|nr:hypothetical protein BJ878DRAFT_480176 [Calycina marina]
MAAPLAFDTNDFNKVTPETHLYHLNRVSKQNRHLAIRAFRKALKAAFRPPTSASYLQSIDGRLVDVSLETDIFFLNYYIPHQQRASGARGASFSQSIHPHQAVPQWLPLLFTRDSILETTFHTKVRRVAVNFEYNRSFNRVRQDFLPLLSQFMDLRDRCFLYDPGNLVRYSSSGRDNEINQIKEIVEKWCNIEGNVVEVFFRQVEGVESEENQTRRKRPLFRLGLHGRQMLRTLAFISIALPPILKGACDVCA